MVSDKITIVFVFIFIVLLLSGCAINTDNETIQSENLSSDEQNEVIKSDLLVEIAQNNIRDNTSSRIYSLIENATIGDLNQLYDIISEYCFLKYKKTNMNEDECQRMIKALIARGDVLKDEAFEEIKNDEENLVKKLYEFQALLRSQRRASGTDKYFSTENVEKVNVETKKIMKRRFERILENGTFEELYQELLLIMTHTPASCGTSYETTKSPKEFGLYGDEICGFKQKIIDRARKKLANMLEGKDLCELTGEETLSIIKNLHNCKELINDEEICEKINNEELVSGYNKLVDKYCSDNKKVYCDKAAETSMENEVEDLGEETEINTQNETQQTTLVAEVEINYYDNVFIGWDFEVLSENIVRDDVYACMLNCGFEMPLELISEEPLICYDHMIDEEVPCEPRPMISEAGRICTEDCLMQFY